MRDITVAPDDPNTIYAALQVGYMLKTTDGGATWRLLDNGLDEDVHAILTDPRDTAKLYISSDGEGLRPGALPDRSLYRSLDRGESWLPIALEFQNEYSVSFAYDPSDPPVMYSAVANGNPGQWRARESGAEATLIRSRDAGETWHELDAGEEVVRGFPEAIAVDPQSPGRVFPRHALRPPLHERRQRQYLGRPRRHNSGRRQHESRPSRGRRRYGILYRQPSGPKIRVAVRRNGLEGQLTSTYDVD